MGGACDLEQEGGGKVEYRREFDSTETHFEMLKKAIKRRNDN